MKHKIFALLIAALSIFELFALSACSNSAGTKGLEYHEVYDDNHTLIGYTFSGMGGVKKKDIVIASQYKGLPVIGIGYTDEQAEAVEAELEEKHENGEITDRKYLNQSFYLVTPFYNVSLFDAFLPGAIETLGQLSMITSVFIPESVTYIAEGVFYGCNSLKEITVAEGNPVYHSAGNCLIETASKTLLAGCSKSEIPDGVTSIGDGAFLRCTGLKSIELPDSVTSIGHSAFNSCRDLTSVELPDSVTVIGEGAFGNCSNLTNVTMSDSVTEIGENAFNNCTALKSIAVPGSVTKIGKYAFRNCNELKSIVIPNSVTSIGTEAFFGCEYLHNVTLGSGLTVIEENMFTDCTFLTSITIPDSVTQIEYAAFSNCSNLKDVYYTGTEEEWQKITIKTYNEEITKATIHYNYKGEE